MRRPNPNQQEDAVTFGNRLSFIELLYGDRVMLWPCLLFQNVQELLTALGNRGLLTCPHMLHRINVEYLQHLQQDLGGRRHKIDPVVYLFGSRTPGGSRLKFPRYDSVRDYKLFITTAIDTMRDESCFFDALNETSPILGDLLAEEMASPDRLPDSAAGEHAPAA